MKNNLNEYIANKVQLLARSNQKKYSDLANTLNVSESFIQKVHIHEKHYNTSHLFVLSRFLNCGVSDFYPTDYNAYKRVYPYSTLKESEFENYLKNLENTIIYRKEDN